MEEKKEHKVIESHVQPPFTALKSFNVDATILSYSHYIDDALCLLRLLSKKTGEYQASHLNILKGFLLNPP